MQAEKESKVNFRYLQRNGKLHKNNCNQKFSMILSNKNRNLNHSKKYIKSLQKTNKNMTGKDKYNKESLKKKSNNKTKTILIT